MTNHTSEVNVVAVIKKRIFVVGAFGGVCAFFAALIFVHHAVISDYLNAGRLGDWAIKGYAVRLPICLILGAVWVGVNRETAWPKAFQFGFGAPAAALAATMALFTVPDDKTADVTISDQVATVTKSSCLPSGPTEALRAGFLALPLPASVANCVLAELQSSSNEKLSSPIQGKPFDFQSIFGFDVPTAFTTAQRKGYSDLIITTYKAQPDNQQKITDYLLSSLQNGGYYEYRINLYILRTLALFGNWSASNVQKSSFDKLKNSASFKDDTFELWYERAVDSYKS